MFDFWVNLCPLHTKYLTSDLRDDTDLTRKSVKYVRKYEYWPSTVHPKVKVQLQIVSMDCQEKVIQLLFPRLIQVSRVVARDWLPPPWPFVPTHITHLPSIPSSYLSTSQSRSTTPSPPSPTTHVRFLINLLFHQSFQIPKPPQYMNIPVSSASTPHWPLHSLIFPPIPAGDSTCTSQE